MTEKLTDVYTILSSIQKNLKAPKDQKNAFGNYVYRKAEDILEAYKKEIEKEEYPKDLTLKHRLAVELIGGRLFLKCTSVLGHNKETEEAEGYAEIGDSLKGMTQAQLTGAVTSYAKKYALCNLFAIDDSRDDPDSKEKPEGETKGFFKENASNNIADDEDMRKLKEQEKRRKAEEFFAKVKKEFETDFGSLAEVEGLEEKYKIKIKALEKYSDLHDLLTQAVYIARAQFNSQP